MNLFQKLRASFSPPKPAPAAPAPAAPPPNWLVVDGERIDLARLSPAQLAALEAHLLARGQQQQNQLAQYLEALAAERARLLATGDYKVWLTALKLLFGEALGRRVATQDVGPGMELKHVVTAYGQPDALEAGPAGLVLIYGNKQTGSYFELDGDVVARAYIGALPPLPAGFGGGESGK